MMKMTEKRFYAIYHYETDGDLGDWEVYSYDIFESKSDAEKWIAENDDRIDYKIAEFYLWKEN